MSGRLAAVVVLVVTAVGGCGGHTSTTAPRAPARTHPSDAAVVGPGKLVDIGGGRRLYLSCVGSGSPTVVLAAGFGGSTDDWSAVQPRLAQVTRACAYDRAGSGNSLADPRARDARSEVDDVQRVLDAAGVPPPYVVVGHSYGGLVVRLFAHAHPNETAGMVLVDAMGRSQDRRFARLWRAQPERVRRAVPNPVVGDAPLLSSEALADRITTLGTLLLAVLTRGRPDTGEGPLPARLVGPVQRMWLQMQDERPPCRAITCTLSRCAAATSCRTNSRSWSSRPCALSWTPPVVTRAFPPARASSPTRACAVAGSEP